MHRYRYKRSSIISSYGMLLLFPLIGLVAILFTVSDLFTTFIFSLFPLFFIGIIGHWIYIMFNITICIDEAGIKYISPWKNIVMKWQDIKDIDRKIFYSGYFDKSGEPKEFEITSKEKKKIRVYIFLEKIHEFSNVEQNKTSKKKSLFMRVVESENVGSSIEDFEHQLNKHGDLNEPLER